MIACPGLTSLAQEVLSLASSGEPLEFQQLTRKDGLPSDNITAIAQDNRGFMWFGTSDGLARYDGYELKVFKNDPTDSQSLSTNNIMTLYEDRQGTIWVGTTRGLNKFDRKTETFHTYLPIPNDTRSLNDKIISAIYEDRSGVLWIGTANGGVSYAVRKKTKFQHIKREPDRPGSLSGNIWVGSMTGLIRLGFSEAGKFENPEISILENLLSESAGKEETRQFRLMKRNAQRLLQLINQLLNLSKLEAGKVRLHTRQDDMIPWIRGIFYSFESLARYRKIGLHFETEEETALLYFDQDKMQQVVTNLLSNAFKFTPEGGTVSLRIKMSEEESAGTFLQIEIADTGSGISAEQLPYVFDRFYQGSEDYPREEQGSGIGLALTKELVELHHGRIRVESSAGAGARFTILLPFGRAHLQDDEIVEQWKPRPAPDLQEWSGTSELEEMEITEETPLAAAAFGEEEGGMEEYIILLVEDNADMRAFIRAQLAGTYRIVEAGDGRQGLKKAIELVPDLIISDVMMPGMDGLRLCDALKKDERTSHIPVILLTAKADIESRLAGLERGADDYLAKPFNRAELLVRSRNLLELRRRLRERYATLQPPAPSEDKGLQIEDAFLQKIRGIGTKRLADPDLDMAPNLKPQKKLSPELQK